MLNALLLSTLLATSSGFSGRPQDPAKQDPKEEPKVEVPQPKQEDPITPKDPKHAADLKRDSERGKKYTEQVDKELKPSKQAEYQERVNRVAEELIPIANKIPITVTWGDKRLNPFRYEFKVVESEGINAFSLPGGYIYVYDDLVKYAESDDELAGVIAHEIAHASLRHVATIEREQSKLQILTLPAILLGILTQSGEAIQTAQLLGMAKGAGWSIQAEEAADYAAMQYMLKSKYNPVGLLTFMERLAKDKRHLEKLERSLGIFQTHPISRERAETVTRHLQEARVPIRRSKVSKSFAVEIKPGDKGVDTFFGSKKIYTFGGPDALARANAAKEKLEVFYDKVPQPYELKVRDNKVVGIRDTLFELEAADAAAAGVSLALLQSKTQEAMKQSLYNLAFRVWDMT